MRHSWSRLLLVIAALPSGYFGFAYLGRAFFGSGWAAAYHQQLVRGMPFEQLDPAVATLYATLVGVLGSLFLAISVAQLVLASDLSRGAASSAWRALLAMNGIGIGGLIAVNLRNGLGSPWWLNSIVLVLVMIALGVARVPAKVRT